SLAPVLVRCRSPPRVDDAGRSIAALDLVLQQLQTVEHALWTRWTTWHVHVRRDDLVDAGHARVVVVKAAARGAGTESKHPLRLGHLLVNPLQYWGLPLGDGADDPQQVALPG